MSKEDPDIQIWPLTCVLYASRQTPLTFIAWTSEQHMSRASSVIPILEIRKLNLEKDWDLPKATELIHETILVERLVLLGPWHLYSP